MRILMTSDTVGGVWTFTRELAAQLLQRGHAVALVSFGRTASKAQQAWCSQAAETYGDSFVFCGSAAPLEWMLNNELAYTQGAAALLRIADSFGPDLLHSSQYCFGRLPIDVPRLITAHSDVLSWEQACRPEAVDSSAWMDRYCTLVQDGLDHADCVVAPTQWMSDALARNFLVRCERTVIPNGRSLPSVEGRPQRLLRAVSAGRLWDRAKGLATLLQIEPPMPVLVAGEESFAGSAAPQSVRVEAMGALEEDLLLAAFRGSSIYIASSIYEPFGLAPLEAALCGCAVVARDIPSLREVWGDAALYFYGASGLETLLRLLADDTAALRQAQIVAMHRAQQLTAERMANKYLCLYEGLLMQAGSWHKPPEEEFFSDAA